MKSSNVRKYLIGLTVTVLLIAIIAIVIYFVVSAGEIICTEDWKKVEGDSCVAKCSDGIWDGAKCVKCSET